MIELSDEECKKIEQEVDAAYERAVQRVAAMRIEVHESTVAKFEQDKLDKNLVKEMKGSFFKRLFG
jgi:ClpP class serine protease